MSDDCKVEAGILCGTELVEGREEGASAKVL